MTNAEKLRQYHLATGASHYYSAKSVLPILEHIYDKKRDRDIVLLSKEHGQSALLLLQDRLSPENFISKFGSIGMAISFGVGLAYVNPHLTVYVVTGDGEWQEGGNWEAYFLMNRLGIKNLEIHIDVNGKQAMGDCPECFPFGVSLHYTDKGPDWTYHYRGPE